MADQPDGKTRDHDLETFYSDHRDRFVDDYAATDPDEDFAETFASWCLGDAPLSTSGLEPKQHFLDGRSELSALPPRCHVLT